MFLSLNVFMISVRESYRGFVGGVKKTRLRFDARVRPCAGAGVRNTSYNETQATTSQDLSTVINGGFLFLRVPKLWLRNTSYNVLEYFVTQHFFFHHNFFLASSEFESKKQWKQVKLLKKCWQMLFNWRRNHLWRIRRLCQVQCFVVYHKVKSMDLHGFDIFFPGIRQTIETDGRWNESSKDGGRC